MENTSNNENTKVERLRASHRTICTDITINASPNEVWSVLSDTASYKDWAVFLIDIQGEIKDSGKITAVFQTNPEKKKLNTIEHTIFVTEGEEFYWAEKGPGGITDNHHFKVESTADGKCRFIQSDELKGGMTWLMEGTLTKLYENGYRTFNRSLKAEAERRNKK